MATTSGSHSRDYARFDALAEEFADRYRRGERPGLQEYVDRLPEMADEIRELFPALVEVERAEERRAEAAPEAALAPPPLIQVGDYRILREVGRGGMGVVYEAEQRSLGRRVALKILPRQVAADARMLERFRREARAAAKLHHTNIVPVFEVGRDGETCYYAMQFIRGQGLDAVIDELRRLRDVGSHARGGRDLSPNTPTPGRYSPPSPLAGEGWGGGAAPREAPHPERRPRDRSALVMAHSLLTGRYGEAPAAAATATLDRTATVPAREWAVSHPSPAPSAHTPRSSSAVLPGGTHASAVKLRRRLAFYRSAARIARQAADALAYAHARGVVHRDIKPSNLLLDTAGVVWVADFGLAKSEEEGLTQTGDLLGTFRYMAPERFRGEGDARADVYALGLTLYELLLLRPAFAGADRLELIERIKSEGLPRPRAVDPAVPRDLETIVLKASDKDPKGRYPSADAMAEDLRRFLDDEPITARRVGQTERLARWARRHPAVAGLMGAIALLLFAVFAGLWYGYAASRRALTLETSLRSEAGRRATEAEAARDQAQRQVVRMDLTTANLHADRKEDDLALHWVAKAWLDDLARLSPGEKLPADREANHRLRVGSALEKVPQLVGFCLHDKPVLDADCDRTGDRVVTLAGDEFARVWDARRGEPLYPPLAHDRKVTSAAFSPQGDWIATSSEDGTARLWDAATGRPWQVFRPGGPISRIAFSPDGATLAAGSDDRVFRWDAATGEPVGEPIAVGVRADYVAYSPEGGKMVTAGPEGFARVWDATTGRPLSDWLLHARLTEGFNDRPGLDHCLSFEAMGWPAFSADGRRLAVSDAYGVSVWSEEGSLSSLPGRGTFPRQLEAAFTPDGRSLLFVDRAGAGLLRRYDLEQGKFAPDVVTPRLPNGLEISPDGRLAAVPVNPGSTLLYELPGGAPIGLPLKPQDYVTQLRFTRDGRRLMVASRDGTVRLWELPGAADRLEPYRLDCGGANRMEFRSARVGPDRRTQFIVADRYSPDGRWEISLEADRQNMRLTRRGDGAESRIVHPGVTEATFSPDGRWLATASKDDLRVWPVREGQPECVRMADEGDPLARFFGRFLRMCFSGDGRHLATLRSIGDGTAADGLQYELSVWDVPSLHRRLGPIRMPRDFEPWTLALNHDGRLAAAGQLKDDHGKQTLLCWDVETGRRWPGVDPSHGQANRDIASCEFSPVDDRLLIYLSKFEVSQWDARTGHPAGPTIQARGPATYSPDGSRIAVVAGSVARLFDARTGEILASRVLPGPFKEGAAHGWFGADGRRLIVRDPGAGVHAWRLPEYAAPAEHLPAFVRLATGLQEIRDSGFVELDADEMLACPNPYRDAWKSWVACRSATPPPAANAPFVLDRAVVAPPAPKVPPTAPSPPKSLEKYEPVHRIAELETLIARNPEDLILRARYALSLLEAGDEAGYRRACADLIERFGSTADPFTAFRAASICLWATDAVPDPEAPVRLVELAVDGATGRVARNVYLATLGAALYRAGRFEEAIARIGEGTRGRGNYGFPREWAFLAMAHHRLGRREDARRWLAPLRAHRPSGAPHEFWVDIENRLLRREAEALILDADFPADPFLRSP